MKHKDDLASATQSRSGFAFEAETTVIERLQSQSETLRTATEAMDIVFHGLDLDRMVFPDDAEPHDIRRRWAAQMLILKDVYCEVTVRSETLRTSISALQYTSET